MSAKSLMLSSFKKIVRRVTWTVAAGGTDSGDNDDLKAYLAKKVG